MFLAPASKYQVQRDLNVRYEIELVRRLIFTFLIIAAILVVDLNLNSCLVQTWQVPADRSLHSLALVIFLFSWDDGVRLVDSVVTVETTIWWYWGVPEVEILIQHVGEGCTSVTNNINYYFHHCCALFREGSLKKCGPYKTSKTINYNFSTYVWIFLIFYS